MRPKAAGRRMRRLALVAAAVLVAVGASGCTTLVLSVGEDQFGAPGETTGITVAFGVPKGTSPAGARLSISTPAVAGEYFVLH